MNSRTSIFVRLNLFSFALLSCLLCVGASEADLRPASLEEIKILFDLASTGPQRMRVVADILSSEKKWSEEQVAAAIARQNALYDDLRRLPEAMQRERTNAVARGHSGMRIRHVQEWYSGGHYRLDQTDEGLVNERYLKDHPGTYRTSFVNIDDLALSPYRSFFADHELRDVELSKTMLYGKNHLWRALGLDGETAFPLLVALADSKSVTPGRRATDADLSTLKINPQKAELIHNDAHPIWHLGVVMQTGQTNITRFILRGRTMSPIEPYEQSDMEFVYEVERVGQRPVCVEASATNQTSHSAFFSKREGFDAQGVPSLWKRTTIKPGSPAMQLDVVLKDVELNPVFSDEQVFSTSFPSNYIISDLTSGQAVVLQKPVNFTVAAQPLVHVVSVRRVILLCVMGLVAFGMVICLLRTKGNNA